MIRQPLDYIEKWNAVLARESWYDAIVFHDYYGGQGFALEAGVQVPVNTLLHPEKFIDESIAALKQLVPGKPIWFTEWNLGQEGIKQWKNQGAELLFIGATFCRMLHHRDVVGISLFHQLYDQGFGAFYLDRETHLIRHNASYELFKLLGATLAQAEVLRPVNFASDDVVGFATQAPDGIRLFAINRGSTPMEVQLPPEFVGDLRRRTLVCPPETRLGDADTFTRQSDLVGNQLVLPAYSISLIAPPAALKPPAASGLATNLFPARPHLTLWYPPYASQQPRVSTDGRYTLDLSPLKDKPMVVVKMDLSALALPAGATCALSFEARAESGGSLTVNLPEASPTGAPGKNRTEWFQLGKSFRPVRLFFRLDPAVNNGEVNFFFDQALIGKGGQYVFQNFRITLLE